MRMIAGLALALIAGACAAAPRAPERDLAAERGLAYAQEACAGCHALTAGEDFSPDPAAPPFEQIANMPGMRAMALEVWLHSAHPSMPALIVDRQRIDDVAAYLAALERRDGE